MLRPIRVLVVDDSAFMRKSISIMLEDTDEIQVIDTAKDGLEGYEKVKQLRPDLVTMDIEMPRMDGLTALKKIMSDFPTPVLMISSLTTEGAEATVEALSLGAVDFIPKELSYINVNIIKIKEDLIKKVKEIVRQRFLRERLKRLEKASANLHKGTSSLNNTKDCKLPLIGYRAVGLGISTGGPISLQKVLPFLSAKINAPVFIVQHMPPKFTKSLAERLNNISPLHVKEAEHGEQVKGGVVYIAPGGFHMTAEKRINGFVEINISEVPSNTLHKPSVDIMLNSLNKLYGKYTLGVIMTGMGRDGTEGIKELKNLGGFCLAQDEASSVIYGMPRSVVEAGFADVISPLEKIAQRINEVF